MPISCPPPRGANPHMLPRPLAPSARALECAQGDFCFLGSSNLACILPKGARALGQRQALPQAGTRAPELLLSRIQAGMPHPAQQGREPSVKQVAAQDGAELADYCLSRTYRACCIIDEQY